MNINYDELEQALKEMQPRQKLYELVRAEMVKRGRWKTAPRGIGFQKGRDPRRSNVRVGE
jgi:hypothetical protein